MKKRHLIISFLLLVCFFCATACKSRKKGAVPCPKGLRLELVILK